MKDVTSTSFGLIVAYILPGTVIVYALGFFLLPVQESLRLVLSAQATASLLTALVGCSLFAGLILHGIRFCLYEWWRIPNDSEFTKLADKDRLEAFRAAVDEMYRYHQWWGGLSVAAPVAYISWLITSWTALSWKWLTGSFAAFATLEFIFACIAKFILDQYLRRRVAILKGESDGRMG